MAKAVRTKNEHQQRIVKMLNDLAGRYSRWVIWQDFITMAAISIANTIRQPQYEARKHGHWIKLFDPNYGTIGVECSVCKCPMRRATEYCPFCGAVMDEEASGVE